MDFKFSPEDEAFRQEVRQFLAQELPADWNQRHAGDDDDNDGWEFNRSFQKRLAKRGWLVVSWPKEYGGQEWSYFRQVVLNEEIAYHQAPKPDPIGVRNVGAVMIHHGTPEQRQKHLPSVAAAEVHWCQLFSEPNAGSDLAALQTTAEDQGDYFLVNGGKVWSSFAHLSEWGILLARTNRDVPKHKGISYFLLDMKTPGITIKPLINIPGTHRFNQVYFDNVKVPKDCLVGEKDRGWALGTATLNTERSSAGPAAGSRRMLEDLANFLRDRAREGKPVSAPIRHRLAELEATTEVVRMLSYRVVTMQTRDQPFSHESSTAKLIASDLSQRIAQVAMQMMGDYGPLERGSKWAPLRGKAERIYLNTIASTIGGGTSEIQRNTIAMRGLGLPRA